MKCRDQLSAEHPLDLPASKVDVHWASVRAVGLELGAIEIRQQRMDFGELEYPADSHRAVTGELLQPVVERCLAVAAKSSVAHALDHVGKQLRAASGAED